MSNLPRLAELIRARNTVENNIANLIGQPVNLGTVGDYIAATIFGIRHLDASPQKTSYDSFVYGPLAGHTVEVQWHLRHDSSLNLKTDTPIEYYLVFTGPKAGADTTHPLVNPWVIESVFLFDAKELLAALHERGVQIGNRTSVIRELWERAEIYPAQHNQRLILNDEQRKLLALFNIR
jgi:hypothetical protein